MDRQQALNRAYGALMAQGEQCVSKGAEGWQSVGNCSYYQDGKRCALGWLFTEETALALASNPTTAGMGPFGLFGGSLTGYSLEAQVVLARARQEFEDADGADIPFLQDLQSWHDSFRPGYSDETFVEYLEREVERVTKKYGLQHPSKFRVDVRA